MDLIGADVDSGEWLTCPLHQLAAFRGQFSVIPSGAEAYDECDGRFPPSSPLEYPSLRDPEAALRHADSFELAHLRRFVLYSAALTVGSHSVALLVHNIATPKVVERIRYS